ncbi:transglycosylase SLT domain-containing protein [Candidatus Woesearchaeota archaeon]|nr:transglycosylase SLT domain-containing protein [Candidatus Woesearchaeota archaeon]
MVKVKESLTRTLNSVRRVRHKIARDPNVKYPIAITAGSLGAMILNEYVAPQYLNSWAEWAYLRGGEFGYPAIRWLERFAVDGVIAGGALTAIKNSIWQDKRSPYKRSMAWGGKAIIGGTLAASLFTAFPYVKSKVVEHGEISNAAQRLLTNKKSLEAKINGALRHKRIHEDAHTKAQNKYSLLKYYSDFTPNLTIAVETIESGGKDLVSPKGASGYMQWMKGTATEVAGLRVDGIIDQTKNPDYSINAAVDWLAKLTLGFRSAQLAITAYNGGQNRTKVLLGEDPEFNFWLNKSKYPAETQNYVPYVLAVKGMLDNPEKYGLKLDQNTKHLACNQVYTPKAQTRIDEIVKSKKISEKNLRQCNPEIKGQVVPKNYNVRYR